MKPYTIGHLEPSEVDSLLDLQKENLKANLDSETVESQGYVSFRYDPIIIERMRADEPQIIARTHEGIVGYVLTATIGAMRTIEAAIPMLDMIETLQFKGKPCSEQNYYIIGQVCVKADFRGQGMFEALYEGHRQNFADSYDFCVTEIAVDNRRSLAAHHRIGFETIHVFFDAFNGKEWHVVAWDFNFKNKKDTPQ
ncbi:MAG: hypothetical protein JNL70_12955 [Saprospiraceae bacterium]|nr:hypothetical protein [Saprospiraceae bacterium]